MADKKQDANNDDGLHTVKIGFMPKLQKSLSVSNMSAFIIQEVSNECARPRQSAR